MTDGENAQHRADPRIRARLAGVLRGHTAALMRLAFTPDGAHIISTDEKYGLRVWDVGSQTCLRTLSPGSYTFTLSPNGKTLALPVPYEARIQLCDLNGVVQGELVHAHTTPPTFLTGAVFTPDGRFLVTGDMAGQIQVWDVATRRVLTTVAGAPSPTGLQRSAKPLAISRDGRWLTVNAEDERGGLQFFALSLPPSTAQGGANAQVAQQVHVQWRATLGRGLHSVLQTIAFSGILW